MNKLEQGKEEHPHRNEAEEKERERAYLRLHSGMLNCAAAQGYQELVRSLADNDLRTSATDKKVDPAGGPGNCYMHHQCSEDLPDFPRGDTGQWSACAKCEVVDVFLEGNVRVVGIRYLTGDLNGGLPDSNSPFNGPWQDHQYATWHPAKFKAERGGLLIRALFKNISHDRSRNVRLEVDYYAT